MPSTRTRLHRTHNWTSFEQHALLCLICRQIPITGLPSTPTPILTLAAATTHKPTARARFRGKRRKPSSPAVELSRSVRHAHRDVADALNRALNFADQERDIPVEEVSAMISQLMEERPLAVAYLERQRTSRVTRSMRRVWERAGMSCRGVGVVKPSGHGGTIAGDSPAGAVGYGGDRVLDSTDVDGEDDPWGDDATTSLIETQPDPWGEEVAAYLIEAQQDPWGDEEAMGTTIESQNATEAKSPVQDTAMIDAEDKIDTWGSHNAPTQDSDLADPWGDNITSPIANETRSSDARADMSSQFENTSSPDFNSSQAQSTASVSTAPKTFREQGFMGINSERLAMLESNAECQDETFHEPIFAGRGMGQNAIELPFNRIEATTNIDKDSETANETTIDAENDESDVSEEE